MTTNTKPTKKSKQTISPFWRRYPRRTVVIVSAGFLILWLLGAPQHSYYFVRCGGNMPVTQTSSFIKSFAAGSDNGYFVPSDKYYYSPPYLWNTTFYCTEQQAVEDGSSPDAISDSRWKR